MSSAHAFPAAAATAKRSRTSTLLPRFAWAVLVYNVVVILWGAVVRATSSGAGCGSIGAATAGWAGRATAAQASPSFPRDFMARAYASKARRAKLARQCSPM